MPDKQITLAMNAVFASSESMPDAVPVQGYDFNDGLDYSKLFSNYSQIGYQGTNLGIAINIINQMVKSIF